MGPRYKHHCDNCIFLGHYKHHDLYWCTDHPDCDVICLVRRCSNAKHLNWDEVNRLSIYVINGGDINMYLDTNLRGIYYHAATMASQRKLLNKCTTDIFVKEYNGD